MRWARWCAGAFALVVLATSCEPARPATAFDFDGDRRADFVWIDSAGVWHRWTGGGSVIIGTMDPDAMYVPGDYDGDGRVEVASVDHGGPGQWVTSGSAGTIAFPEPPWPPGTPHASGNLMVPVPGRYDGGTQDIPAWYRDIDGTWFIQGHDPIQFGNGPTTPGTTNTVSAVDQDLPVPADYDGDGTTDLAVYSPRTGSYRVRSSIDGTVSDRTLLATDAGEKFIMPVPGDYDGVGHAQAAVWGSTTGWMIEGHATVDPFGTGTVAPWESGTWALPAPADYDGDGTTDLAVVWGDGTWQVARLWTRPSVGPVWGSFGNYPIEVTTTTVWSVARFTLIGRCLNQTLSPC